LEVGGAILRFEVGSAAGREGANAGGHRERFLRFELGGWASRFRLDEDRHGFGYRHRRSGRSIELRFEGGGAILRFEVGQQRGVKAEAPAAIVSSFCDSNSVGGQAGSGLMSTGTGLAIDIGGPESLSNYGSKAAGQFCDSKWVSGEA